MRLKGWTSLPVLGLFAVDVLVSPVHAGGAYVVDDATIGNLGECHVETWVSTASNRDLIGVTQPACVAKVEVPIEFTAIFQGLRTDAEWTAVAGLQGKAILVPMGSGNMAVALTAGTTFDLTVGGSALSYISAPVTINVSNRFRINLNSGWSYDAILDHHHLTWGGGFEWNVAKSVLLIAEVFGQTEHLPSPRFQAGLRYVPVDNVDLDIIYGNNISGERDVQGDSARWLTAGVTLRF